MAITLSGSAGIQNVLGSASAPADTNTTTPTTGVYYPSATTWGVSTAGTNALYIDASQNVGIGTTSPGVKLDVSGSNGNFIRYTSTGGVSSILGDSSGTSGQAGTTSNHPFNIITNATPRISLDTSGNVGIGVSSNLSNTLVLPSTNGNGIAFGPTTSNFSTIWNEYSSGDLLLASSLYGSTSSQTVLSAYTGTVANNAIRLANNGYIAFYTNSATAQTRGTTYSLSSYERMRIDTSGNLLVGYTSSNGSYKLQVNSQIFATSSTIATSDANYKTNVTPLTGALDLVSKLNPVSFNWKQHPVHDFDTQNTTVGFLAQEVQTALSGQVYVNSIIKESEVTLLDKTKEKFLGIAEGNMIAILTKAIQELKAEFDQYKAAHP